MNTPTEQGKAAIKLYERLKSARDPLDKEYQDCYRYTYPTLGAGFNRTETDGITNAQATRADQAKLFDSTATDAVRLLSSSTLSSLTPPNTRWFDLAPSNLDEEELDQEAKEWLTDSAERIHTMIHGSNYDTEALEFTMHQMIAGMAGIYIELRDGKYRFETWPLHHLYCQETLHNGYIDTVCRAFQYTAQEAVNEFGYDKLPQKLQDQYDRDPYDTKKSRFVVCIRPRLKGKKQSTGRTRRNLPWESLWVAECGTVVREAGFHEMPVIVPRWLKVPDTDYARGPVFDALPDIKSLNAVKEKMHLNMDMHISGMWKVKDDGIVNPATIKIGPRRMIPVGDMENLQELKSGGDIQFAMNEIANLQASIRRVLLADQLGPTEKAIQTATEVTTRNNQIRQVLGPIFARLQSEYLTHLVTRCFGLVSRANMLPQPPKSLTGRDVDIVYRSPLARSQKMQELQAIDEYVQRLVTTAQNAQQPEMLDRFNFDKAAKKTGDLLGIDPELLNDDNVVKKIRMDRQRAQQAAMQQQQQALMAQQAANQPASEAPEMPLAA